MIKKILLSCILVLVLGIVVAERHPQVKNAVAERFKTIFEQTFDCTMQYRVESVSFFHLSLVLRDVTVKPRGHAKWQWHADTYGTKLSWRDLLWAGMLSMTITLDGLTADSQMPNQRPAILDHLRLLFAGPNMALATCIKNLTAHKLTLSVHDAKNPWQLFVAADLSMGRVHECISVRCALANAQITYGTHALLTGAQGALQVQTYDSATNHDIAGTIACACTIPQLPTVTNIVGSWDHDHGTLKLTTHDGAVAIDACTFATTEQGIQVSGQAHTQLHALCGLFSYTPPDGLSAGIMLDAHALITDKGIEDLQGTAHTDAVHYAQTVLGSGDLTFAYQDGALHGQIMLAGAIPLKGIYTAQLKERTATCSLQMLHAYPVPLTHWVIEQHASCDLAYAPDRLLTGTYAFAITHTLTHATTACKGSLKCDGLRASLQGTLSDRACTIQAALVPHPCITNLIYGDEKKPLLALQKTADAPVRMRGNCDVTLVKEVAALWGYDLHGQGTLALTTEYLNNVLTASIALTDGTIQLPKLYNCISAFQAQMVADIGARQVRMPTAHCTFHTGTLTCTNAQLILDDSYQIKSAHVPLMLNSWLLAAVDDFSAQLSGSITYHQDVGQIPHLAGKISIEQAHAKENIFSQGFLQRIRTNIGSMRPATTPEVDCVLDIETKNPFHVHTEFLETDAHLAMHVRNRLAAPELSGSIELTGGQLFFPYKPLFIRKGALYFVAGASLDPMIELVAHNTIKGHDVRLQLTGSLSAPTCILEATPSLTEPQVASLLFAGSPDGSINSIAPALIMSNITSLLLDHMQSWQALQRYFGPLFKPLKNIHIIPRFSDQEARGGIRTGLEVEVGDRWRALIQKNLSLTEDTKFELEYLVSDDISIKGTRNERGDVYGEVEVRYGF